MRISVAKERVFLIASGDEEDKDPGWFRNEGGGGTKYETTS